MKFTGFWGAVMAVIGLAVVAVLVRPGAQTASVAGSIGTGAGSILSAAEGGPWQG